MLHTADKINRQEEYFQSKLKLFSMFKIRVLYDETIGIGDVPESVVIMCINPGKFIGCSFDNQMLKDFIVPFVLNMVLQNVGLSCIIKSNQKINFNF